MSQLPQDNEDITIISEAVTITPSNVTSGEGDTEAVSEYSEQSSQYPPLTNQVKEDISRVTKEWIRLDDGLSRIRKMKGEFEKEKKVLLCKFWVNEIYMKVIMEAASCHCN